MKMDRIHDLFRAMKDEGDSERSNRWRGHFDRLAGSRRQIVLFGAGAFGKLALNRLRNAGIEPCCFSDNNSSRWGTSVDSVTVLKPSDAIDRFGNKAVFVVTIFNGSQARDQLRQMGCQAVLPAAVLFWKFPREFMPDLGIDHPGLLVEQGDQIRECYEHLADESSKRELCNQIEWRYWMRPEFLPLPTNVGEIYFPDDLVTPNRNEIIVDCGAYDGDCIRTLLRRQQQFKQVFALEPNPANRASLAAFLARQPSEIQERVTTWPHAVGDRDGMTYFEAASDVTSKVSDSPRGIGVECRKLDSLNWPLAPTYIKMDIEGSEPRALLGGADLLQKHMPVLAICLYHRSEHLWQIPNLIHSIEPRYSLYLRRYAEDCWETVCYAIPEHRRAID